MQSRMFRFKNLGELGIKFRWKEIQQILVSELLGLERCKQELQWELNDTVPPFGKDFDTVSFCHWSGVHLRCQDSVLGMNDAQHGA